MAGLTNIPITRSPKCKNNVDESPNFVATYQSFAEESQLGYMFRRRRRRCRTPHETADRPSTRRRPVGAERAERAGGRAGGQVSPPSLPRRAPSPRYSSSSRSAPRDCLLNTAEAESVDTTSERVRSGRSRIIKIITQIFNPIHTNI